MNWFEALVLGIIQGLTEFLPISSSGHLEIGKALFGIELENNLAFDIVVHFATVCSTILVFRKEISRLFSGLFQFAWNEETQYISKLVFSSVPVILIGLFFEDYIESIFAIDHILILVGIMLLVTALLLAFTLYAKSLEKEVSFMDAFIIGIAQTIAVLPGLSRSGATIAAALLLKNRREDAAKFSFLMVLLPIAGKASLGIINGEILSEQIPFIPLFTGFVASFLTGFLACRIMIGIVKRSKLIYFALYCGIVAILTIIFSW